MSDEPDDAPLPEKRVEELSNPESEAMILGAMMSNNSLIDRAVEVVSPSDFSEPLHARLFEACAMRYSAGKGVSPVSMRPLFKDDPDIAALGGISYLAQLTGLAEAQLLFRDSLEHVADMAKRRKIRDGLLAAAEACADFNQTLPQIVAHADQALQTDNESGLVQLTAGQSFKALLKGYDAPKLGVTCHQIPSLDDLLGPIRRKQMIVLAGRPGMGKTAVAVSYAVGAARSGFGTLFFTLEMGHEELTGRAVSDICYSGGNEGVPYSAIADGEFNTWQRDRVMKAGRKLDEIPLEIVDAAGLSLGRLAMIVRRTKRKFAARGITLDLVVVDYLQLMRGDNGSSKRFEIVTEVSMGLKAIAKENDLGVLALSQLSRNVEQRPDKRPQLADLRESGQLEQDADGVLFLLREEYYLHQAKPDELDPAYGQWLEDMELVRGRIEFIQAKRRGGVVGTAIGEFHGGYQAVR